MIKRIILLAGLFLCGPAFGEYLYCSGKVVRVQIDGPKYLIKLNLNEGGTTVHVIGVVGDAKSDKYFPLAMAAMAAQQNFVIRYTDPGTTNCGELVWANEAISYINANIE